MMHVRKAANTLQILEYFADRLKPATATELAEDLGWPRSSTFKLVGTLADLGYLYEPRARNGYYPSPRWLELADKITRADPLPQALQAMVVELAEETGETTLIAAPAGEQAIFLYVRESRQPVRYFTYVGDRVPVYASSAGRALLAQLPTLERERIYRKLDFQRYSPTTPASLEAVEAEIEAAAARGYHQSNAEFTPDLAGVALPLPYAGRRLSIVVVGPISRCLGRRKSIAATIAAKVRALPV
jgi:DNA-binding IclR family transcriptional regulator